MPQVDNKAPINVKLLLIGNSSVGKSSLLLRFSDEQWLPEDEASATIGVDFRVSVLFSRDKLGVNQEPRFSCSCVFGIFDRCTRWT